MCGHSLIKYGAKYLKRQSIREQTVEKVQRWRCEHCRTIHTFRKQHSRQYFTTVFMVEAVKDFIQGRSPVGVIHDRKGVSVGTLSSWIRQFGEACMSPVKMSGALRLRTHNRWSGILLLDAKYLNKRQLLLLAVDYVTLDIVAWLVVEAETVGNYTHLVDMVNACGYHICAVVSDGHPAVIALTHAPRPYFRKGTRMYPRPGIAPAQSRMPPPLAGIPHQWCVVHALRDIDRYLATIPENERTLIRALVHDVLFARTISRAMRCKRKLEEETALAAFPVRRITAWIGAHWDMLTIHHAARVGRRKIPRSTNAIENTISYVNARLKTMRRLRTPISASAICNLIVVNYRTKCFRNPKNHYHRGKSPLALVTGKKQKFDWMKFVKKPTP